MALTYSQLVTQIRNYTEVDSNGLSDNTVSIIVQNTENRIFRELNIDAYRLYASSVTTAGTTTISVPSGLRNIRYVEMISPDGEISNLEQKDSLTWQNLIIFQTLLLIMKNQDIGQTGMKLHGL